MGEHVRGSRTILTGVPLPLFIALAYLSASPFSKPPIDQVASAQSRRDDQDREDDDNDRGKPSKPRKEAMRSLQDDDDDEERRAPQTTITITARKLDAARARIDARLGAATYEISNDAIENRPGGETRTLGSVLVQAPGVTRDGRGSLIVRGSQNGLQYRLNGIILPTGAGDLGEALSARLAASTTVLTGALPAQYGLAPSGVVNVTTKDGHYLSGGQAELYGGAHRTVEPALEWSFSLGATSLFMSGSYRRSDLGLPAPTSDNAPRNSGSRELEGFAYLDRVLDDVSRISLITGTVNERSRYTTLPGTIIGSLVKRNIYGIAAYQRSNGPMSLQASIFGLSAQRRVGASLATTQRDLTSSFGLQVDAAHNLTNGNVLRAGLVLSEDSLRRTFGGAIARLRRDNLSVFVQDEWTLAETLTANFGLRGDKVTRTDGKLNVQPRATLVWKPAGAFSAHFGYSRSVAVAPMDESSSANDASRVVERSDLIDAGVEWRAGGLVLGFDAYSREVRNLFATRYRLDAPTGDVFAYDSAHMRGIEVVATYGSGPFNAWGNMAWSRGTGSGVSAGASVLPVATYSHIAIGRVDLDTDQRITGSAGASVTLGPLLLSGDLLIGSGTPRTLVASALNASRNPSYATIDLAVVYHARLVPRAPTDFRLDVRNGLNRRLLLTDGSSVEGGAPGWNEPRGIYFGLEQAF